MSARDDNDDVFFCCFMWFFFVYGFFIVYLYRKKIIYINLYFLYEIITVIVLGVQIIQNNVSVCMYVGCLVVGHVTDNNNNIIKRPEYNNNSKTLNTPYYSRYESKRMKIKSRNGTPFKNVLL